MVLDLGPFDWTPDGSSRSMNLAIRRAGARWNVRGPGSPYKARYSAGTGNLMGQELKPGAVRFRDGTRMMLVPNRTYTFTAWGKV